MLELRSCYGVDADPVVLWPYVKLISSEYEDLVMDDVNPDRSRCNEVVAAV